MALLALLSLAIVASFQAVGTLLVFTPPATATLLVKKVQMVSILVGFIAVVAGLLISFHYGTAGGATMAGISVLEFFIVMIGRLANFKKQHPLNSYSLRLRI